MTKLPVFQTRNPPKQLMWLGASRRHLQRRPPDRGNEPLLLAAHEGHLEVVQVLLAAGASVEAKNDNGCGPQRRDGRDRTDVVGRRCNRRNVEEMRHAIEFAASFKESSVYFTWFHVEKSSTSRQQLQVCVAGMSHGGFLLRLQCVIVNLWSGLQCMARQRCDFPIIMKLLSAPASCTPPRKIRK